MVQLRQSLALVTRLALVLAFGGMGLGIVTGLVAWAIEHVLPGTFTTGNAGGQALRLFYTLLEPLVYLGMIASLGCALLLLAMLLLRLGRRN